MIISELNYLESAEAEVLGGKGININSNFDLDKDVDANVYVNETYKKTVELNFGGLSGNGAEVLGTADAQGNNTFSSIIFGTQTGEDHSESFVNSFSASN